MRPDTISPSAPRPSNSEWLVATITTSASWTACSSGWVGEGACGSHTATSASSRSSSRISFGESESRSSSVSRLNVSPSTATLRSRATPIRRLIPSTRNSGTDSLTRETASSMPGAAERSSENAKSLRRQVPAVIPGARSRRAGSRG